MKRILIYIVYMCLALPILAAQANDWGYRPVYESTPAPSARISSSSYYVQDYVQPTNGVLQMNGVPFNGTFTTKAMSIIAGTCFTDEAYEEEQRALARMRPGGTPGTPDVQTSPIGDGLIFMLILAVLYVFFRKRRFLLRFICKNK